MQLANKKVTTIGARRSGVAVANLVLSKGGIPKISDSGTREASAADLQNLSAPEQVATEWGGHTRAFVEDSDLIILSPGVRLDAEPVQWARAKNIPVWGEIELAWQFCTKPVIAVTGSNGKTTVVNLITKILEAGGLRPCLCGNVGSPFSGQVLQLDDKDFVVLEISSFQLESIQKFCPHIAVFLNFSQNHLDRHKDLTEYFDAKKKIFLNQSGKDYAVLNQQNEMIKALAPELKAKVVFFNAPDVLKETGLTNPNQQAVFAVGQILGISGDVCRRVFSEFKGVEHRLEWVRSVNGIEFINDSKATTAEASRWAMQSFDRPIVMICGGRDKNIDFSVLREVVKTKVKRMIVIGEAREKIRRTFSDVVDLEECGSLKEAVQKAQQSAALGESVVFSPMCASFDMFANFEERGRVFKQIVWELFEIKNEKVPQRPSLPVSQLDRST